MEKTTHTPGPWRVSGPWDQPPKDNDDLVVYAAPKRPGGRERELIARFFPVRVSVPGEDIRPIIPGEHAANARLFVAAPDLLAVCEEALAAMQRAYGAHDCYPASETMPALKAAIAKARGQEPGAHPCTVCAEPTDCASLDARGVLVPMCEGCAEEHGCPLDEVQ